LPGIVRRSQTDRGFGEAGRRIARQLQPAPRNSNSVLLSEGSSLMMRGNEVALPSLSRLANR
ncbi:MAG: hypothetical protein AB7F94_03730, partial [Nitrospira sp.]